MFIGKINVFNESFEELSYQISAFVLQPINLYLAKDANRSFL